ncbi:hypothetical protein IEN91_04395 [Bacillus velezensis]|uniref:hypothetical protein n=1 Tax=Bacillus velezensis TaxID=492670 RepID=UPI0018C5B1DA|nr:hypothetical protein [Bacillus velezensis]QPK89694.1 hypothetical protein IEN91_04395 [Bacillus velezensis]
MGQKISEIMKQFDDIKLSKEGRRSLEKLQSALVRHADEICKIAKAFGESLEGVTTSLTRKEIVNQAKEDIKKLVSHGKGHRPFSNKGNTAYQKYYYQVVFRRSDRKRRVTALIYRTNVVGGNVSEKPIFIGRATCHPDACFNTYIGKAIALRRALGLNVPDEYLDAPEPEGVETGDVVYFPHISQNVNILDVDENPEYMDGDFTILTYSRIGSFLQAKLIYNPKTHKVIDDTFRYYS